MTRGARSVSRSSDSRGDAWRLAVSVLAVFAAVCAVARPIAAIPRHDVETSPPRATIRLVVASGGVEDRARNIHVVLRRMDLAIDSAWRDVVRELRGTSVERDAAEREVNVEPGVYVARATVSGCAPVMIAPVRAMAGKIVEVPIDLVRAARLEVRVRGLDGEPIERALVRVPAVRASTHRGEPTTAKLLEPKPYSATNALTEREEIVARSGLVELASGRTDEKGTCLLDGVPAGSVVEIVVEADGYATWIEPLTAYGTGESTRIDVRVQKAAPSIRGVVKLPDGRPAVGAAVIYFDPRRPVRNPLPNHSVPIEGPATIGAIAGVWTTREDGSFELFDPPSGDLEVHAVAAGHASSTGLAEPRKTCVLTLAAPTTTTIELKPAAGDAVVDPIVSAFVHDPLPEPLHVTTDAARRRYQLIGGGSSQTLLLVARAYGCLESVLALAPDQRAKPEVLEWTLPAGTPCTITTRGLAGAPRVERISCTCFALEPHAETGDLMPRRHFSPRATRELASGEYQFSFDGLPPTPMEAVVHADGFRELRVRFGAAAKDGPKLVDAKLELEPSRGELRGRVLDRDGKPVTAARIEIRASTGTVRVRAGTDGTFAVRVPREAEALVVSFPGHRHERALPEDLTNPIDVRVVQRTARIDVWTKPSPRAARILLESTDGRDGWQTMLGSQVTFADLVPGKYTLHGDFGGGRHPIASFELKPGEQRAFVHPEKDGD